MLQIITNSIKEKKTYLCLLIKYTKGDKAQNMMRLRTNQNAKAYGYSPSKAQNPLSINKILQK